MALSIRNLSACILLAIGGLTAIIIIYSRGGESGLETPAIGQQSSAATAERAEATIDEHEAAPEGPDVEGPRATVGSEEPEVAPHGPVLLPLNPPYLSAPIENETATPAIAPTEEEAPNHAEEAKETKQDFAVDEQPAKELLALRQEPAEDKRSADAQQPEEEPSVEDQQAQPKEMEPARAGQPAEEQPAEEEPSVEDQPREMEPAHAGQPAEEQPTENADAPAEQPVEENPPAEEEQPNETADEGPQEVTPHGTLPEISTPSEPPPKRELTPVLAALRDRVRRTVAFHRGQALSATENTATEVMHSCLAFGCNTQIYRSGSSGEKVNGITCLCWDYPCGGYELLGLAESHIAPRVGYGRQEHPSQLLAVLALACVKTTYPMRVGEDVRTVADLVEYEKLSCRLGTDQSLKLIGLAYYVGDEVTWENSLGQQWSVERIIKNELDQPIFGAVRGGTLRLMGLGYALARREKCGQPLEGEYARARRFIDEYGDYALKLQNPDGSWGPRFLAAKGTSRDPASQLRSTGHVLQWLVMSLPEDRLDDPRLVRSVEYVNRLLASQRYGRNIGSLSTREIGSVMHALHALVVYDERLFQPRTLQPSAAGGEKVAQKSSSS